MIGRRDFVAIAAAGLAATKKTKAATTTQACNNCWYFYTASTFCRRYPPSKPGVFPLVASTDWCGEYKVGPGPQ